MGETAYDRTRRSLHALAELVLAGPRYRAGGTIRLRVRPDGFGTWDEPEIAVAGGDLVGPHGRFPVAGLSCADVASRAGLSASALADLYHDGPGVDDSHVVELDPDDAATATGALWLGDRALRELAPDHEPVLWPEHFDVGVTVAEVNFGVSPGDASIERPYAYVGPHHAVTGEFWNQPFGAARPMTELDGVAGVAAFFREGAHLAAR